MVRGKGGGARAANAKKNASRRKQKKVVSDSESTDSDEVAMFNASVIAANLADKVGLQKKNKLYDGMHAMHSFSKSQVSLTQEQIDRYKMEAKAKFSKGEKTKFDVFVNESAIEQEFGLCELVFHMIALLCWYVKRE